MKKLLVTSFALFVALVFNVGQSFAACCPTQCCEPQCCQQQCCEPCCNPCCEPAKCCEPCCDPCVTGCAAPCCECQKCDCDDSDKYCNVNGCCKKKSWLYRIFHRRCCGKNSNCGCVQESNCCPKCDCCD